MGRVTDRRCLKETNTWHLFFFFSSLQSSDYTELTLPMYKCMFCGFERKEQEDFKWQEGKSRAEVSFPLRSTLHNS